MWLREQNETQTKPKTTVESDARACYVEMLPVERTHYECSCTQQGSLWGRLSWMTVPFLSWLARSCIHTGACLGTWPWKIRGTDFKAESTTFLFSLFSLDGVIYRSDLNFARRLTLKSVTSVVRVIPLVGFSVSGKYVSQKVCILQMLLLIFFFRKGNFFHKTVEGFYNAYKWSLLRFWQICDPR